MKGPTLQERYCRIRKGQSLKPAVIKLPWAWTTFCDTRPHNGRHQSWTREFPTHAEALAAALSHAATHSSAADNAADRTEHES